MHVNLINTYFFRCPVDYVLSRVDCSRDTRSELSSDCKHHPQKANRRIYNTHTDTDRQTDRQTDRHTHTHTHTRPPPPTHTHELVTDIGLRALV